MLFYHWLRKNGYPTDVGIRIHCWNCNEARNRYRVCPHELARS